jgi:hypothetical protein
LAGFEFAMLSFPAMARLITLIVAGTILGSCSSAGNLVGDYLPAAAGGLPKGTPPRPGTPEYDALRKKSETEANRDKSKDAPAPKADLPGLPK